VSLPEGKIHRGDAEVRFLSTGGAGSMTRRILPFMLFMVKAVSGMEP
jgi:hypothetical protein